MNAQKDKATGKWKIQYYYESWDGQRKKSTKRGFPTKRQAEDWLRNFLMVKQSDLNMRFSDFVQLYFQDVDTRLRENTIRHKHFLVNTKILPYFGGLKMNEITPASIRSWQTLLIKKGYAPTYLKSINNQLTSIFNYAVSYYNLKSNPCTKAGSMGKNDAEEMEIWTNEEFARFSREITDSRCYVAFRVLYYCGLRIGELLALTRGDIDFDKNTLSVTKSYQRINKRDVVTPPKTANGRRIIIMPQSLAADLLNYMNDGQELKRENRLFPLTYYYFKKEMNKGTAASGVKPIRLHDLRHSHASHLIELGFTPLAISKRLGHKSPVTTLKVYSHLFPNKQEELADRLDRDYRRDQ